MSEPWGITGPQFINLYIAGLALAVGLTIVWQLVLRRAAAPPNQGPLTVEQIAFLAGGPNRVTDTALAALIDRGAVRTRRGGGLYAVTSGDAKTPVEEA